MGAFGGTCTPRKPRVKHGSVRWAHRAQHGRQPRHPRLGTFRLVSMDVSELFRQHEATISALARKAGIVQHAGDRGGNREEILRTFLSQHLPRKYGVTKG